jgi:hypothetical protein
VVTCWGESEGGMRECMQARVDAGERPARDSRFASRTCSPIPQNENFIGPEGARHLARALEKMTGMQTLHLVSHVCLRVRVRAGAGRLLDTGHGPGPGRLEAGQAGPQAAWAGQGVLGGGGMGAIGCVG